MKFTPLFALIAASLTCSGLSMDIAPVQTGYLYYSDTDIDDGGEVSSHFFHISGSTDLYKSREFFVNLSASYRLNSYDFSDGPAGSFASLNPWDDIHAVRIGSYAHWQLSEKWRVFGTPTLRSTGESGANFSDSLSGGIIMGASYKFSDTLTLGSGFGYLTQLEDSANIFPIVVIDWKLSENLSLSTGPIVGASQGPGISLHWKISDEFHFTFGARSERSRFRLNDSTTATKQGVGEDNSIPVFGILTWQATEQIQASLIAGVGLSNDLLLDNSSGNRISRKDSDPSPFLGINLGYRF